MKLYRSALTGVVCFLGLQGLAFAGGTPIASVQDGDWNDTATWNGGTVPNLFSDHEVSIDHIVAVTTAGNTVKLIRLGNLSTGTLNISSGDVTVNTSGTSIGWNNASTINLSGGTFTSPMLLIGVFNVGTFNMSGGDLITTTVTMPLDNVSADPSSFVLSGGALTLSGTMTIGAPTNNVSGTLTIAGNAVSASFRGTNNGQDGTVHFTSESTLVIRPDGPMSNDLTRFDVGTVNIDTGATLELDPQYEPQVGDEWFIFISSAVVGGTAAVFTNVVTPAGITISQNVVGTRGVPVGPEKLIVTVTAAPPPSTWVDFGFGSGGDGSEFNPYNTLALGLANVTAGGTVKIKGDTGTSATIETPTINQDVTLVAPTGPVFIGLSKGRAVEGGFVSRGVRP